MAPRARATPPPRSTPPATAAEDLADRLHSLAIHLLRRLRAQDVRMALTGPRASALSVIVFAGPLTLGELAAAEQVRPPTMTRLVRALEARGLVRREPDPADRRVVRLRATPKGVALLQEGRRRRVQVLAQPLSRIPAHEFETLRQATEILNGVVRQLT